MYILITKNTPAAIAALALYTGHITTTETKSGLLIHEWDKVGASVEEIVTALGDDFKGMLHVEIAS